ncbi:MAG: T9SS type A sorting domain-containing protein [Flavobacteriales bacterium]|nr:T9SS type A sorting domain-containing protein [Flavobacteriia bacterium]NCP53077.1 T9SS type A sorting domain-containing protein [Flavobacteriales bacterium]NCP60682.1 T9SS type A sorting domain-containing protein [Flavobacteriales bacterium]NCQ13353.1 T9SS type A sorting domain-containing protein [Flavobacteriales bacterium]NCQ58802.1 T9SS type A sorting domain-containing protein [Flavobacteriales bacterium]
MKKFYTLLFLITAFVLNAQTTIFYPQRVANYSAFFSDNGGNFDQGTDQFGMWANGGGAKQSVAWRNFTEDGTTSGTPSTMAVGDSFTITVSATQASFGVIGLALLSSPTSTISWADRRNNYAVQVNLNGNSGANDPWEVVSNGGTINASSIGGSTSFADFKFKFTLNTATTMTVSINDGAEIFNITLNNQDITGYSVYFADDWNGVANENIFWKPTTEYTYAITLDNNEFRNGRMISAYPNPTFTSFQINHSINDLKIFDITGKLVKSFNGNLRKGFLFDISSLKQGLYLIKIKNDSEQSLTSKLVKL